jgi:hypothetical protein
MKWISADLPPDDGMRVLVWDPTFEDLPRTHIARYDKERWYDEEWGCYEPTYWMPLPDPPE